MESIFGEHGRYYMYTVSTKALIPIVGDYKIFHKPVIVHKHNIKKYDLIYMIRIIPSLILNVSVARL